MTATTIPIRPQPFATLLRVEMRKLVDTRSGRAALGVITGLCMLLPVWMLFHTDSGLAEFRRYTNGAANAAALLLPIVVLLAMTSEWTQRTALTTFTLSPNRGRVIAAKFLTALALCTAALAAIVGFAALVTVIGGSLHEGTDWLDAGNNLRSWFIIVVLQVVMAAAFGALAGNTAVAIVAYLVAPIAWSAASQALFGSLAPWLDIFDTYSRLSSMRPWLMLPQTLTSIAVWVVVPGTLGIVRSLRREVQ